MERLTFAFGMCVGSEMVIEKLLCGSKKNNSKKNDKDDVTTTCVTATMTMTKCSRLCDGNSRSSINRRRRLHRNVGGDHDRHRDVDVATTEESSSIPSRFADLQASPSSSLQLLERKGSSSSRVIQPLDNDEKHRSQTLAVLSLPTVGILLRQKQIPYSRSMWHVSTEHLPQSFNTCAKPIPLALAVGLGVDGCPSTCSHLN